LSAHIQQKHEISERRHANGEGAGLPQSLRWSSAIWLQLIAITFIWSANWIVSKAAYAYASAFSFLALRFAGALLAMVAISLVLRLPLLPLAGERLGLGLIGLLQVGGMVGFSFAGLAYLGPGRAAVLTYTMPIWCIPLGWLLARSPVIASELIGGFVGLAGLLVFLNPSVLNWADNRVLIGNGLCLAGAIAWALGACLYRRRTWQTGSWTQTLWQVFWSTILLAPPFWMAGAGHPIRWTPTLILGLVYNAVLATAFCYLWWGRVLAAVSASKAGQFLTLVPVMALLMSRAMTSETISLGATSGVVLICAGLFITLHKWNRRLRRQ
jgi:drug/metabolite transporter (DMT)-like permease